MRLSKWSMSLVSTGFQLTKLTNLISVLADVGRCWQVTTESLPPPKGKARGCHCCEDVRISAWHQWIRPTVATAPDLNDAPGRILLHKIEKSIRHKKKAVTQPNPDTANPPTRQPANPPSRSMTVRTISSPDLERQQQQQQQHDNRNSSNNKKKSNEKKTKKSMEEKEKA